MNSPEYEHGRISAIEQEAQWIRWQRDALVLIVERFDRRLRELAVEVEVEQREEALRTANIGGRK